MSSREKTILMKTYNFVRTINGLAAKLGMPERLNIVSPEDQKKEIDFAEALVKK